MEIPATDIEGLAEARRQGAPLLDVRKPDEYEEGHVPGAVLVPLDQLPERADEVPDGSPLYVICGSGGRSGRAAEWLQARGVDAVNVAGGTKAWIEAGQPVATGPEAG